ncbi:DUF285 domain-containing protein [Aquiflexum sp. LQ15W]|uniref:BspA family leucine-rich repeat surface protein n=1 Tax=Cognataquiflexum nitidum TaxID=2922272 RepID=UPI001F13E022|nr:DUF285 domain-containing protein [Cognataquiflexum nitidum]MCH6202081.1 DUF285 domain-containing protein [Cognataquiflexum nitidum]
MILKIHFLLSLLSFWFNDGMIYKAANNITLKAADDAIVGKEYQFEGKYYLVVNDSILRELVKIDTNLSYVVTTKVRDMSYLFFNSVLMDPKIESWDVSNVKDMSWMFGLALSINPDLSNWDTRSVILFSDMFHGTKKFQGDLSKWNTSSGQLFNGMFFESNFNGAVNDWDISSAKNLSGMFDDARLFNQPLDKWNTSNVEDMGGMFAEALNFNQDISMWDVSAVKNMTNMFRYAISFSYDLSNWEVPLIEGIPDNFDTKSSVISPKWNTNKGLGLHWYIVMSFVLLGPVILILVKSRKKKSEPSSEPENEIYLSLKAYLIQKNTNRISKAEIDDFLGISNKNLESQKKIRSNFIKEFNGSGIGEIYRVRDEFDSRSYNYEVNWKKEQSK